MVFSLFGRKAKTDSRRLRDGMPVRIPDTTLRGPSTTLSGPNTATSSETQREIARRTAEKIDQIESEMIEVPAPLARPASPIRFDPAPRAVAAARPVDAGASRASAAPAAQAQPATRRAVDDDTEIVLGSPGHAGGGIEITASALPADLEEAAILFANGQAQAAATTLRSAIARGALESSALQGWAMLFDVLQASGAKLDHEAVALEYAARFEKSPPAWVDRTEERAPVRRAALSSPIVFPAQLDGAIERQIEQFQRAAAGKRPVVADLSAAGSVDAAAATLLVANIDALERAGRELVLLGVPRLLEITRTAISPGRRDESDACWKLALLCLRLLGEKQAFDDMAIDFCVTYEVSPPSWEPVHAALRTALPETIAAQPEAPRSAVSVEGSALALRGEVTGRMPVELAALRDYASGRDDVVIDCRGLLRLDFAAAGELLNEVVGMCSSGKSVLFVEPSMVVEALLMVMGIHELADIRRRKI